jgi:hypothetical protein
MAGDVDLRYSAINTDSWPIPLVIMESEIFPASGLQLEAAMCDR